MVPKSIKAFFTLEIDGRPKEMSEPLSKHSSQDPSQTNNQVPAKKLVQITEPSRVQDNIMARLKASATPQSSSSPAQKRRETKLYKKQGRLRHQAQRLRLEISDLEQAKATFQDRYNYIVEHVVLPYTKKRNVEFDDKLYGGMELTLRPLREDVMQAASLRGNVKVLREQVKAQRAQVRDSEDKVTKLEGLLGEAESTIQALQDGITSLHVNAEFAQKVATASTKQVQALQKQLLAGVDTVQVHTDDQLSQDFQVLAASVKSLSRSVRMVQDFDVSGILKPCGMLCDVDVRHWDSRARIKSYIEAWVWSTLMVNIFSGPFRIFGKPGQNLDDDWGHIFEAVLPAQWPKASPACEKWRYITMEQLLSLVGQDTITKGHTEVSTRSKFGKRWSECVLRKRKEVAQMIAHGLLSVSTWVDGSRIPHVIDQAFSLAFRMSLQRCRTQVVYPRIGANFVKDEMESMPDANGDDMTEGAVAFVVNPGLTKWGDANGKMLEHHCHIVLPLVQLDKSNIKRELKWEMCGTWS
ncbi:hypothetical protein ACEQ8H_006196 [Pleosporales sp. CAS-2024a]